MKKGVEGVYTVYKGGVETITVWERVEGTVTFASTKVNLTRRTRGREPVKNE